MDIDKLFRAFDFKRNETQYMKAGQSRRRLQPTYKLLPIDLQEIMPIKVSDLLDALEQKDSNATLTSLHRNLIENRESFNEIIEKYFQPGSKAYHDFLDSSAYVLLDSIATPKSFSHFPNFFERAIPFHSKEGFYSIEGDLIQDSLSVRLEVYCESQQLIEVTENDFEHDFYNRITSTETPDIYSRDNNALHAASIDFMSPVTVISKANLADDLNELSFGNTPLLLACKTGHGILAMELIAAHKAQGVSLDQPDEQGMTPLHWACFFRDDDLIKALVENGANTALRNESNQSALDVYTTDLPRHLNIARTTPGERLVIAEGRNIFNYDPSEENVLAPRCFLDIIFHMDKIAFHKLGVSESTLLSELKTKRRPNRETGLNDAFVIFNEYHLTPFIMHRNAAIPSPELKHLLRVPLAEQEILDVAEDVVAPHPTESGVSSVASIRSMMSALNLPSNAQTDAILNGLSQREAESEQATPCAMASMVSSTEPFEGLNLAEQSIASSMLALGLPSNERIDDLLNQVSQRTPANQRELPFVLDRMATPREHASPVILERFDSEPTRGSALNPMFFLNTGIQVLGRVMNAVDRLRETTTQESTRQNRP